MGRCFRLITVCVISAWFLLGIYGQTNIYAQGKEKTEPKVKKTVKTKEVIGELISLTPIRNPRYISVACAQYDATFIMGPKVEIERKRSLDDIKLGDWVSVVYDEETEQDEETGKKAIRRVAKKIKFVKPATTKARKAPDEMLEAEEAPQIKGILKSY